MDLVDNQFLEFELNRFDLEHIVHRVGPNLFIKKLSGMKYGLSNGKQVFPPTHSAKKRDNGQMVSQLCWKWRKSCSAVYDVVLTLSSIS